MPPPSVETVLHDTVTRGNHPARMHISLRQLELFACVVRNASYSRAAAELGLTQPAVSVQIRNLEEAVGVALLEYVGRRLHLTDAGRELYRTTITVFDALDRFTTFVADTKGLRQGRLHIAAVTTAKYFLPRLLGLFCERHPGVDAELAMGNRAETIARLQQNAVDLCVMGEPPTEPKVVAEPFMDDELVAIARSDHPLADQSRIPLQRIAQEPFLMREPGSGTRRAFERLLAEQGLEVSVRMEFASNEAIKQAVLGGLGVAVISRQTLAVDPHDGSLAILDVIDLPLHWHWYIVHRPEKRLSIIAREFRSFLHEHVRSADSFLHDRA